MQEEMKTYQELKEILLSIPNEQHQAMLCTIYACMARVSEVMIGRLDKTPSLKVEDLRLYPEEKLEIYVKTGKKGNPRKIILCYNREKWLIDIIVNWANKIDHGEMFPYTTSYAMKYFKKYFPEIKANRFDPTLSKHTIHWLRGWRYTHYRRGEITGKRVDSKIVSLLGGWVSSTVPERLYDFTKIDDYEKELQNS